jgi:hypothetical protein
MKKIFKILLIVIVLSSMFILPSYKVYATDNVISGGQGFVDLGKNQDKIKQGDIKSVSDQVYNILLAVATVTAVLVGAVLGIQFMTGSMEDQAKVKESLVPFVFGCIIVFGAFGIWKVASLIASSL